MKSLISDRVNSQLDDIVTEFFNLNRVADRGVSVLNVKYGMINTERILHSSIAHIFPLYADKISSYQASRNNLTFYGETMADNTLYEAPIHFFERLLDMCLVMESRIHEAIEVALEEQDISTKAFLDKFLLSFLPITEQLLVLIDKLELYGDDFNMFDNFIEKYITDAMMGAIIDFNLGQEEED